MLEQLFGRDKTRMIDKKDALKGRAERPFKIPAIHYTLATRLEGPWPDDMAEVTVALGCFWGAERKFWELDGVYSTMVGYAGGYTPHPTYEEVCAGKTGHTEVVRVIYDPRELSLEQILKTFWESHDPTQGMRQGNDTGTQYRSAIYVSSEPELELVQRSRQTYQAQLDKAGLGKITTEIKLAPDFYYAEDYHQQYLAKNPNGYCGIGGTGVSCPIGLDLS